MVEKYKLARKDKTKRFGQTTSEDDTPVKVKEKHLVEADYKVRKARSLTGDVLDNWVPKTKLGKMVQSGEIKSLDEILDKNMNILEPLIVDYFVGEVKEKVVDTKKTSYVRMSGRKYSFRCTVLIGDGNKYLGLGTAKDKDKWNAVRKAARKARLNVLIVNKGCGSWQCTCGANHSVPFTVVGKCGSVKTQLMPAPRGVGLVVAESIKPIFEFIGIKDVWGKGAGNTATSLNFLKSTVEALRKTHK